MGDTTEGFLHYGFGGLIFEGAYFRNFTVCTFRLSGRARREVIWFEVRASDREPNIFPSGST